MIDFDRFGNTVWILLRDSMFETQAFNRAIKSQRFSYIEIQLLRVAAGACPDSMIELKH
jgi:hypothetical protein